MPLFIFQEKVIPHSCLKDINYNEGHYIVSLVLTNVCLAYSILMTWKYTC